MFPHNKRKLTGNVAVGAYLRRVRELRGYGRAPVAQFVSTTELMIKRIETGEIDTSGSKLMKFTYFVEADPIQVMKLFLDDKASAEDGRELAERWVENTPNR
jgi:transcriptional regulator with XRE-family HTH domain